MQRSRRSRARNLAIAFGSLAASVAGVEISFRLAGFDFEQKQRQLQEIPVFARQPTTPTGEAFFRRPGPDHWHGKVLTTLLRRRGVAEGLLPLETAVSIDYDREGFRNPDGLSDWTVVVVGDSFTELGFLPADALFTTVLADRLGVAVKNLGVSYTGPLTHVSYLRDYGDAPSARHAVLAFYEGNDIEDLVRESWAMERARQGLVADPVRAALGKPQSSFIEAMRSRLDRSGDAGNEVPWPNTIPTHEYVSNDRRQPVTVRTTSPAVPGSGSQRYQLLEQALSAWGRTSRSMGMEPWLVYLPTKRRVLQGHLERLPSTPPDAWRSSALPALVRRLTKARGIAFVNPIPALRTATRQGQLSYNPVLDTHLNRVGSQIVAEVLAKALAERIDVK